MNIDGPRACWQYRPSPMTLPRSAALRWLVFCLLASGALRLRAASQLQLALDDDRLNFTSAGSVTGAAWQTHNDPTQSVDLLDGARAPSLAAAGDSWITATITGPAIVDFMWALEGTAQHRLTCSLDGVEKASCEPAPLPRWTYASVVVPTGGHTLRWNYHQSAGIAGKALLDRVGRTSDTGAGLTSSPWIKAVLGEPVDHQFTTRRPAIAWVPYFGSLPPGLTIDAAGHITGTPTEAGLWFPSFTIYATGSALYYSIGIEVADVPTLHGALDSRTMTFTTTASDGNSVWQPVRTGGHEGDDCLLAGLPPPVQTAVPYQPGWSSLQTTVTGPDSLSYWVKVAHGRVVLLLDDKEYRSHGPLVTLSGWQRVWLVIPDGAHTITWRYEPFPGHAGTAWLDDVRLRSEGKPFINQQPDITSLPGGSFNYTVPSANAPTGWTSSGLPSGLSMNAATGTVSGTPQRRGVWSAKLFLEGPTGETDQVLAMVDASIPPADATDLPNSWWRTETKSGAGWFGENDLTHDGTDAMRSPQIIPGATATLTTAIEGPGTLTWWWSIPAGTGGDVCALALDGATIPAAAITGPTAWKQETLALPAGVHQLAWRWKPEAAGDPVTKAAVLDQVSFAR